MSGWKDSSDDRRESVYQNPVAPNSQPAINPGPQQAISPGLLEKVLENTLGVGEAAEPLDGATRASLQDFAKQNGGAAELSESLLADLVRIVLRQEMALLANQPNWPAISEQVAQTIWQDPVARSRIANIWRLLQGQPI